MLLRTCGAEVITEYEALVERVRDILTIEQSVLITGFSGAGKSHLAERLGSDLGVSMVHLDEYGYSKKRAGVAEWLIDFGKVPEARIYEGTADNLIQWAAGKVRTIIFPIPDYESFIRIMRAKVKDGHGQADPSFVRYWNEKSRFQYHEYVGYAIDRLFDRMARHALGHFIVYPHLIADDIDKGWHEQ
jgi:adenylate kinase family enzyme